jgi:hypothetical protein
MVWCSDWFDRGYPPCGFALVEVLVNALNGGLAKLHPWLARISPEW